MVSLYGYAHHWGCMIDQMHANSVARTAAPMDHSVEEGPFWSLTRRFRSHPNDPNNAKVNTNSPGATSMPHENPTHSGISNSAVPLCGEASANAVRLLQSVFCFAIGLAGNSVFVSFQCPCFFRAGRWTFRHQPGLGRSSSPAGKEERHVDRHAQRCQSGCALKFQHGH